MSNAHLRQREAEVLRALRAAPTLPEQRRLVGELNGIRAEAAKVAQDERDLDLSNTVIRDHLTPVATHTFHTASTDWMLDEPEAPEAPEHVGRRMLAEASTWFDRLSKDVVADQDEYQAQAEGVARRVASMQGNHFEAAKKTFLDHADFLRARVHPKTAAPTDGQQSFCRICGIQMEGQDYSWYALSSSTPQRDVGTHVHLPARLTDRPGEFNAQGDLVPGVPGGEGGQYDAPAGTIYDGAANPIMIAAGRKQAEGPQYTNGGWVSDDGAPIVNATLPASALEPGMVIELMTTNGPAARTVQEVRPGGQFGLQIVTDFVTLDADPGDRLTVLSSRKQVEGPVDNDWEGHHPDMPGAKGPSVNDLMSDEIPEGEKISSKEAKKSFEEWMEAVDAAVQKKAGLSVHDLADIDFMGLYESGVSPGSAANQALRNEGFFGSLREAAGDHQIETEVVAPQMTDEKPFDDEFWDEAEPEGHHPPMPGATGPSANDIAPDGEKHSSRKMAWTQTTEMISAYPGLTESMLVYTTETNGYTLQIIAGPHLLTLGGGGRFLWGVYNNGETVASGDGKTLEEAKAAAEAAVPALSSGTVNMEDAGQQSLFAAKRRVQAAIESARQEGPYTMVTPAELSPGDTIEHYGPGNTPATKTVYKVEQVAPGQYQIYWEGSDANGYREITPADASTEYQLKTTSRKHAASAGWPRVPSPNFPGETVPSCPECGSTETHGVGAPLGGRYNPMGKSGGYHHCRNCGYTEWTGEIMAPMTAEDLPRYTRYRQSRGASKQSVSHLIPAQNRTTDFAARVQAGLRSL